MTYRKRVTTHRGTNNQEMHAGQQGFFPPLRTPLPDPVIRSLPPDLLFVFIDPVKRDAPLFAERSYLLCILIRVRPVLPEDMEHDQFRVVRAVQDLHGEILVVDIACGKVDDPKRQEPFIGRFKNKLDIEIPFRSRVLPVLKVRYARRTNCRYRGRGDRLIP